LLVILLCGVMEHASFRSVGRAVVVVAAAAVAAGRSYRLHAGAS